MNILILPLYVSDNPITSTPVRIPQAASQKPTANVNTMAHGTRTNSSPIFSDDDTVEMVVFPSVHISDSFEEFQADVPPAKKAKKDDKGKCKNRK